MRPLLLALIATCSQLAVCQAQHIAMDASKVLNRHADQVGIWVNTNVGNSDEPLANAIRNLKLKSIRYGWQCGVLDMQNLISQLHTPNDKNFSGYLSDGKGRMWETFGPNAIASLMRKTNTTGFAVLSTDGINYIGTSDQKIAQMSPTDRLDFYAGHAANWAKWATTNQFEYFEIGNENDLSGDTHTKAAIKPWSPADYARIAQRFLKDVKRANPNAKCGINGGLKGAEFTKTWFREIFQTAPTLAKDLDFVVAHKYEMWLDEKTWALHPDWDLGRVSAEFRTSRKEHFPNLPIHVTEIGSWKTGENNRHYRALLATEMLGNVRMDEAVEHVQFWPTRWQDQGVLAGDDSHLTPMGLGLAAYTRFAQPIMFGNGYNEKIRYFAAKGDDGATFWFVNHANKATEINCHVDGLATFQGNEAWSLESPSVTTDASDTVLKPVGEAVAQTQAQTKDGTLQFSIRAAPLSVTIVAFSDVSN